MKLVEELDYQFDFDRLRNECPKIFSDSAGFRISGLSVQHREDVPLSWSGFDGLHSSKYNDKDYTDKDYNIVHSNFKNSEYEKIINDFNLVRSKIMVLYEKRCYSIHKDKSWRLHIPIETNPGCLFYFPDHQKHFHLEEGKVYKVNTTEKHTFINTGDDYRVHFIGCI